MVDLQWEKASTVGAFGALKRSSEMGHHWEHCLGLQTEMGSQRACWMVEQTIKVYRITLNWERHSKRGHHWEHCLGLQTEMRSQRSCWMVEQTMKVYRMAWNWEKSS